MEFKGFPFNSKFFAKLRPFAFELLDITKQILIGDFLVKEKFNRYLITSAPEIKTAVLILIY